MKADACRGAKRIYGWSFHSQGMPTSAAASARSLIAACAAVSSAIQTLAQGSPWSKGERLAELARQGKSASRSSMASSHSRTATTSRAIRDPSLRRLIEELARENSGLCVITTREPVDDLDDFDRAGHCEQVTWSRSLPEAGRALLRVKGVRGSDAELELASRDFGNHALAINLLASYLRQISRTIISATPAEIPDLDIPEEQARHARRVMEAFAKRFGDGLHSTCSTFSRCSIGQRAALASTP